jgi:GTP-binding protein
VLADIPGLIEGAAEGAGIGDRFLGHVERTRLLLHLVDSAAEDPAVAWVTVREEMARYGAGLSEKAEILALSRADLADTEQIAKARKKLKKAGAGDPVAISAATGDGVDALLDRIIEALGPDAEPADADARGESRAWSPL